MQNTNTYCIVHSRQNTNTYCTACRMKIHTVQYTKHKYIPRSMQNTNTYCTVRRIQIHAAQYTEYNTYCTVHNTQNTSTHCTACKLHAVQYTKHKHILHSMQNTNAQLTQHPLHHPTSPSTDLQWRRLTQRAGSVSSCCGCNAASPCGPPGPGTWWAWCSCSQRRGTCHTSKRRACRSSNPVKALNVSQ